MRFTLPLGKLRQMLNLSRAPLEDKYNKVYFNGKPERIATIANAGESIWSYCTYREDFYDDISVAESESENGAEFIVDAQELEEYLNFVGGEEVTISLFGEEDERLAKVMEIEGDLSATIYLPTSNSHIEAVLTGIVNLYDDRDRWLKPSTEEPMDTRFVVDTDEMLRIVQAKEFDQFSLNSFPLVIEEGELLLEASDNNNRNQIEGTLTVHDVDGGDFSNTYSRGFKELFESLSGTVECHTEQDHPLTVVYDEQGMTGRYGMLDTE